MKVRTLLVLVAMSIAGIAHAGYNEDLQLNQKVDSYYVAKDQQNTLVILIPDAYGPRAARYTVLSESDIRHFQTLNEGVPYKCKFQTKAAVCASAAPDALGCGHPYYRYIVSGLECTETP